MLNWTWSDSQSTSSDYVCVHVLTYKGDDAYRNHIRDAERKQQYSNDRDRQLPDDEMKVNVPDSIGIHLKSSKSFS